MISLQTVQACHASGISQFMLYSCKQALCSLHLSCMCLQINKYCYKLINTSFLTQDYTCEIGACLLQLKDHDDPSTVARMKTLTLEAVTLTGRTMLKPANHKALVNSRLDDAGPISQKPGKAFYQSLLVRPLYKSIQASHKTRHATQLYLTA